MILILLNEYENCYRNDFEKLSVQSKVQAIMNI